MPDKDELNATDVREVERAKNMAQQIGVVAGHPTGATHESLETCIQEAHKSIDKAGEAAHALVEER